MARQLCRICEVIHAWRQHLPAKVLPAQIGIVGQQRDRRIGRLGIDHRLNGGGIVGMNDPIHDR